MAVNTGSEASYLVMFRIAQFYNTSVAAFLSMFMVWVACTSNDEDPIGANGPYDVDPIFEPYVLQFIEEAAARGFAIDFSDTGLKIELSDREVEFADGFCYQGASYRHK